MLTDHPRQMPAASSRLPVRGHLPLALGGFLADGSAIASVYRAASPVIAVEISAFLSGSFGISNPEPRTAAVGRVPQCTSLPAAGLGVHERVQ